jgi:hypothetical protein
MLTSDSLSALTGIRHGFFTREGGVSEGLYASLNCGLGSGDDLDSVAENRTRALAHLGLAADRLATVYQVHSNRAGAWRLTGWPPSIKCTRTGRRWPRRPGRPRNGRRSTPW